MSNINQLVLESNDPKTFLAPMDISFFKSIDDYEGMYYKPNNNNFYYTLIYNNQKAGVVGIILENNLNFFQIAIHPKYRRLGLVKISSDLIVKKHNLKVLRSTIEHDNIPSIKSHEKAGFKMLSKKDIDYLILLGRLEDGQIRMIKTY